MKVEFLLFLSFFFFFLMVTSPLEISFGVKHSFLTYLIYQLICVLVGLRRRESKYQIFVNREKSIQPNQMGKCQCHQMEYFSTPISIQQSRNLLGAYRSTEVYKFVFYLDLLLQWVWFSLGAPSVWLCK